MTTRSKTITYSNQEITVLWQPLLCLHVGLCFTELPEVFNPAVKKWIDPYAAPTEKIIEQVNRCPTGALSFIYTTHKLQDK